MKKIFYYFLTIITVSGCVSNTKYNSVLYTIDSLEVANETLLEEIDELKNGEDRLVNLFNLQVKLGKYLQAQETYKTLKEKHPESAQISLLQNTTERFATKAQMQRDSLNKAIRDSIRLANIDDIGEWSIGEYVDDFGDKTGKKYIYQVVYGVFSNSATSASRLKVTLRFYKSSWSNTSNVDFSITCDEYANGVIEEDYYFGDSWKIVCPETRTVYGGYFGSIRDRNNHKNVESSLSLFRQENTYEFTIWHKYNTVYQYSIKTHGFNNALLKAGIDTL